MIKGAAFTVASGIFKKSKDSLTPFFNAGKYRIFVLSTRALMFSTVWLTLTHA